MKPDEILAIVVSYNGSGKIQATVQALIGQVGGICIVDNGSAPETQSVLEALACWPRVTVLRLGENRGIGHALNLGMARARTEGFPWVLTMDQDSLAGPTMVEAYSRSIQNHPERVCLAPDVILQGQPHSPRKSGPVPYAITSGNLVRTDLFDQAGAYNEELFIDSVDFDFCLRVRRQGWEIWRVGDAQLLHELGEPHAVPWPFSRIYTSHSPTRRYYMFRNFFYLAEQHIQRFPVFIVKSAIVHVLLLLLVPFFDQSPLESLTAIGEGIRDFFSGHLGMRAKPSPR